LKAARQRALVETLHGKPKQTRDEQGRFAAGGFDGGARTPTPMKRRPEREHDELVVNLSRLSRLTGSGF